MSTQPMQTASRGTVAGDNSGMGWDINKYDMFFFCWVCFESLQQCVQNTLRCCQRIGNVLIIYSIVATSPVRIFWGHDQSGSVRHRSDDDDDADADVLDVYVS